MLPSGLRCTLPSAVALAHPCAEQAPQCGCACAPLCGASSLVVALCAPMRSSTLCVGHCVGCQRDTSFLCRSAASLGTVLDQSVTEFIYFYKPWISLSPLRGAVVHFWCVDSGGMFAPAFPDGKSGHWSGSLCGLANRMLAPVHLVSPVGGALLSITAAGHESYTGCIAAARCTRGGS